MSFAAAVGREPVHDAPQRLYRITDCDNDFTTTARCRSSFSHSASAHCERA